MGGREGLVDQVGYPVTYLDVMRRDEAALLAIEIMQDSEASLTSVVVTGKVCRIYYVSKNIESLHSWSLNSNLFTMNRETESHNPNLLKHGLC